MAVAVTGKLASSCGLGPLELPGCAWLAASLGHRLKSTSSACSSCCEEIRLDMLRSDARPPSLLVTCSQLLYIRLPFGQPVKCRVQA